MADDKSDPLLYGGLALVGLGVGAMILQKKPAAAPGPAGPPGPTGPPAPIDTRYRVTAVAGLIVHTAPSISAPRVATLAYNTPLSIDCQTWGDQVAASRVWDRISAPIAGYVTDWWVSTPLTGRFSPGLAVCGGAGPLPPSGLAPTGSGAKAPIARWQDVVAGWIVSLSCQYGTADYLIEPAGIGLDLMPYGYEPAHRRKRLIATQMTWNRLTSGSIANGAPRSCLRLVTPGCLASIAPGPELRYGPIRGGMGWLGFTLDNPAPRIAPRTDAGGWC
jgi:hypothetical protein